MPINYFISKKSVYYRFIEDKIKQKIESFGNLPVGWDYGGGVPASREVIEKAFEISDYKYLFSGFKANARPTTDGGIIITLYIKDHFLDIIINADLTMDLRYEIGIGENYDIEYEEDNIGGDTIFKYLSIIEGKCILSEPYTLGSTQKISGDLEVIVSGVITDYLSLLKNVQKELKMDQFVPISGNIIPTPLESPQSISV